MQDQNKHLLILSSWYPTEEKPFLGNFVERQASLLAKKYKVTVVDTRSSNYTREISIEHTDHKGYDEIVVQHPKGNSILKRKRQSELALSAAFEIIEDVDLVIGNILLPKGLQFIAAKKRFNCPLFYIEHGSYFRAEQRKKWSWKDKTILWLVRRYIDEVIAVSIFLQQDLESDFPKHKIRIIGNHIDHQLFNYNEKITNTKKQFLHVSTLDNKTKNPIGIIEACAILKEKNVNFELTIISDEDYKFIEESVVIKQLAEHIHFIGAQSWEDMPKYYHDADAFILFSDYESFSIVLAEAWATGTPTIATSVGIALCLPEFLGINVQKRNPQALAGAMLSFIEGEVTYNPEEIVDYSRHFSSERILKRWDDLIHKHLG